MKKNYDELFKIEHSDNNLYKYNVYRKNIFNKFKLVANVKITPCGDVTINYLKRLSFSEESYLENYFLDLANLKIEKDSENSYYFNIYRKNSNGDFESVARADISVCQVIIFKELKPHEGLFISRFFRNLIKQE